jgi:hypothetical protein
MCATPLLVPSHTISGVRLLLRPSWDEDCPLQAINITPLHYPCCYGPGSVPLAGTRYDYHPVEASVPG